MLTEILRAFQLNETSDIVVPFGNGLINRTFRVDDGQRRYVLQCINTDVFKNIEAISNNMQVISEYLHAQHPEYGYVAPIPAADGQLLVKGSDGNYYRLFPFIEKSVAYDVVSQESQAYEAARQFGRFTRMLAGLDVNRLQNTLPDFHNLTLRYQQFGEALQHASPERVEKAAEQIQQLQQWKSISDEYAAICTDPEFKLRVTHHDTKISNVLFSPQGAALYVIDLDTVMPGYFISDVGDMMRTYLSPVSEEEMDYSKIEVRESFFEAIVSGYMEEMQEELSAREKSCFIYAGEFLIYMQALRFLTDYLNNDVYYGEKYAGHNLVRAGNQIVLLQRLQEKKPALEQIMMALH